MFDDVLETSIVCYNLLFFSEIFLPSSSTLHFLCHNSSLISTSELSLSQRGETTEKVIRSESHPNPVLLEVSCQGLQLPGNVHTPTHLYGDLLHRPCRQSRNYLPVALGPKSSIIPPPALDATSSHSFVDLEVLRQIAKNQIVSG